MTTEEKAKAYDEAIKVLHKYDGANIMFTQDLKEEMFPKLKESKDERIRKRLINYFHGFLDGYEDTYKVGGCVKWEGLDVKDVITWLENQVHVDKDEIVKGIRRGVAISLMNHIDANSKGMCLSNMECEDIENAIVNENWGKVYGYMKKKLEKQGEQNLDTDFSDLRTWKYIVDTVWTEKEGIGQYLDSPFTEEVAKKLQKRFGNIEQKPTDKVEPKFKVGQTIKKEGFNLGFTIVKIEDGFYYNDIGDYFPFTDQDNWELVESAWSEEDDKMFNKIASHLNATCGGFPEDEKWANKFLNWLKSLKDRVQPQPRQEWSEEDDIMVHDIDYALRCQITYSKSRLSSMSSWIYELKNRIQPKQEWSKRDLYIFNNIYDFVKENTIDPNRMKCAEECIDWLNSLKDRYTWKPSDKQMRALKGVCDEHWELDGLDPLYTLYQDLKKLK